VPINKKYKLTSLFSLLLLLLSLFGGQASAAEQGLVAQQELQNQKYQVWQYINQVRNNPRSALDRLHLSVDMVQTKLGAGAWILDAGLSPLAWNDQLAASARAHGRDMLDRLYYNYYTPEGVGPGERIEAAGYQADIWNETLGVLVFRDFVDLQRGIDSLLENVLRDEFLANESASRNLLSPVLTQVGVAIFAETVPLLDTEPYVYLLVMDFARPTDRAPYVVGQVADGEQLFFYSAVTQEESPVSLKPGGGFQIRLPEGGGDLLAVDDEMSVLRHYEIEDNGSVANQYAQFLDN